ncbi:MAG: acetyl-CoA carboxylase carboxyltransferase subunit alpha [Abditibacteriales bacterium]|nr:acetyl-CoA carboxylase carboxyltransferase subunit alpha [Abditibacteriales bacterium]
MMSRWLPFEEPLVQLDEDLARLDRELQSLDGSADADKLIELRQRRDKLIETRDRLLREIFSVLKPWHRVQIARHQKRPYPLDYINGMCSNFIELHGDRTFGDDGAVVAGLARLDGRSVVMVGYQKGRDVRERQRRNFGMPLPEGLRKARRVMELADKFGKPVISFVDTPGAACLVEAEERGISEAIARNQMVMSQLRVPVVVIIVGEGNSGGAIALALGDKVFMLEHAYYSVISPEGCASILWRDGSRGADAAAALHLTAEDIVRFGVADGIIPEPPGGAHRDPATAIRNVKATILQALAELDQYSPEELVERRYQRYRHMGVFRESRDAVKSEP